MNSVTDHDKGLVQIFNIEGGDITLSPECYTEPYLKAIVKKYKDPIPALCYIYYKTYPWSAYNNFEEDKRDEAIMNTYPGEYSLEDPEIIIAVKELELRYDTPIKKFFMSQKKNLDTISAYFNAFDVSKINDDNQKGNLNSLKGYLKDSPILATAFTKLEDIYKKQMNFRNRGGAKAAYDEDYE